MAFNLARVTFKPFGFQLSPYGPSYSPIWHVLFAYLAHLFAHLAFFFIAHLALLFARTALFVFALTRSPPFDFTGT